MINSFPLLFILTLGKKENLKKEQLYEVSMKRKLIKQGKGGYTITLPIDWVRDQNLEGGDDLTINTKDSTVTITPDKISIPKREIFIRADKIETSVRTLLANAYRAGFDRIHVTYTGDKDMLAEIIQEHLLGFEMLTQKEKNYLIESVAEPSYDDFETIMQRQFHIILDIIRNIEGSDVQRHAVMIQKYDNFLKRCISKRFFSPESGPFFWQLISNLTQISRQCYRLNKILLKKKKIFSTKEKEYLAEIEKMFALLQKSYFSKDLSHLMELHIIQHKLFYEIGPKLLQKNQEAHYLMYLARLIYLANSPLTGYLQIISS